jgi:hypothetical protein
MLIGIRVHYACACAGAAAQHHRHHVLLTILIGIAIPLLLSSIKWRNIGDVSTPFWDKA